MSEKQFEDELVRVVTTDWERIVAGFHSDRIIMPNEVVPLSRAIKTIEEFITMLEAAGYSRHSLVFYVEACKDGFPLFSYDEKGIQEDRRNEERPKRPLTEEENAREEERQKIAEDKAESYDALPFMKKK